MLKTNKSITYYQYKSADWGRFESEIIVEHPISLTVNSVPWLSFMCTPTDLEALAVGFLYNERLIDSVDQIESVRLCQSGDNIDVWTANKIEKPEKWLKTSGCTGGVTSIEPDLLNVNNSSKKVNGRILHPRDILKIIQDLFDTQNLYRKAGGVHSSAISDGEKILASAEDIGRHNTLDKIAGLCLIHNIKLKKTIIVTTGRISSEMLQKSKRLGASIVISRTSPSSLSIQTADAWGITLIGYARRDQFKVYAHPERIMHATQISQSGRLSVNSRNIK